MESSLPSFPYPDLGLPAIPPGSFGRPHVGEAREFAADPIGFVWQRYQAHGPIFKSHLGTPHVFMIGPEANRLVLDTHREHFSWAQGWPKYVRLLWGDKTLNMKDGEDYLAMRQLLAPAFNYEMLVRMFDFVWDTADRHLELWSALGPQTFFNHAKTLVSEAIYWWLTGGMPQDPKRREIVVQWLKDFTAIPAARQGGFAPVAVDAEADKKLVHAKMHAKVQLERYLANLVASRRTNPTDDVVSLWVDSHDKQGHGLSDDVIAEHVLLFLVAGGDSTASMLTWVAYALARYPEVQQKLRTEADAAWGDDKGRPSVRYFRKLPYLGAFLKEVERHHPTQYGGVRKVVKPFEFKGYSVPAGWHLRMSTYASHHLPEVFKDPFTFDPERFARPREEDKHIPYALIGFGNGHRQCTGKTLGLAFMEAFALRLVHGYDLTLAPGQDFSPILYNRAVFLPKDLLKTEFARRSSK